MSCPKTAPDIEPTKEIIIKVITNNLIVLLLSAEIFLASNRPKLTDRKLREYKEGIKVLIRLVIQAYMPVSFSFWYIEDHDLHHLL